MDADDEKPMTKKDLRLLMLELMGEKHSSSCGWSEHKRKCTRKAQVRQEDHDELENKSSKECQVILVR